MRHFPDSGDAEELEDGPFVSFTDLLVGVLFLLLILVAALLLRQTVATSAETEQQMKDERQAHAAQVADLEKQTAAAMAQVEKLQRLIDQTPTSRLEEIEQKNAELARTLKQEADQRKAVQAGVSAQEQQVQQLAADLKKAEQSAAVQAAESFRPAFVYNQFECHADDLNARGDCNRRIYTRTERLFVSGDRSKYFATTIAENGENVRPNGLNHPMSAAEVEATTCTTSDVTAKRIVSLCEDPVNGRKTLDLTRTSPTTYAGTAKDLRRNITYRIEWQVLNIVDDQFR